MKILALNSGGLDSIVMLHKLKEEYPFAEIQSIVFNYGQLTAGEEIGKAIRSTHAMVEVIDLPTLNWTQSQFYSTSFVTKEERYLESRNLIFLSYALSYAQAGGYNMIATAILSEGEYFDTCPTFLDLVENLFKLSGVLLYTMEGYDKEDIVDLALEYGITTEDFHSCDVSEKPCGVCPDCLSVKRIK